MLSPAWVLLMQSQVWPCFFFFLHWFKWRCGIPVVVMGETGCGKTCLIRYMCGLQSGPGGPKNMLLMKVDIFLLLFVCGCVCASGEGGGVWVQGDSLCFFFFFTVPFSFGRERRRIFGCRFCPPEQWHLRAWAAKGFLWCNTFCFVDYHWDKRIELQVEWLLHVLARWRV